MKEQLKSKTILLVSSASYFLATGLSSLKGDYEIIASGLSVLAFLTLVFGAIQYYRESK